MTDEQLQAAADLLWRHWQEGRRLGALPPGIRPTTRAEGYAVQALVERRSGAPLFGWKIAATSAAGQAHINVDGPLAGRLLREKAFDSGAELPFGANHMRVAEAEFAFRMGARPGAARNGLRRSGGHGGGGHAASGDRGAGFALRRFYRCRGGAADRGQCLRPPLRARAPDGGGLAGDGPRGAPGHRHGVRRAGLSPDRDGKGANVLGDPRVALAWLVNELSGLGIALKAGEVVTTGTCVVPVPIAPGDTVTADFGILGAVTARLA